MSNTSLAVIARSDVATQCNANPSRDWLYGITTVADEDPTEVISMYQLSQAESVPDPLPDVATCWLKGMHIANGVQFQFQDIFGGTDPGRILVVCDPAAIVVEGTTVSAGGMVCSTDVSAGASLLADFTQPAVSGTVTANVDTSFMVESNEVHVTGGGIFTVTTITDPTHAVLTFSGIASALVKIAA